MPIYDYVCDDCGGFTAMVPMAAFAQPQPCPVCGGPAARDLMTAPALGGGAAPAQAARAAPRHPSACGCCAPRGRLRADAVAARK
jgi:putative FmdB family regulatory protein